MRELTSKDYKDFKSLCSLSQKALRKTLLAYLKTEYDKIYHKKDYILAVGDIPIALVAHMDTVFKTPPKDIYYDKEQGVIWSPDGLGADDRAGVFLILKVLQTGLKPTIIFTADEEKGALGAEALVDDFIEPPCKINYIVEVDRRGTNDCVFYDCDNASFVNYIEKFGFYEALGSFSDISIICPDWKIAGVNLSVGYEDEHSYTETFHIYPFFKTFEKVLNMLQEKDIPKFEYFHKTTYFNFNKNIVEEEDIEDGYCSGCKKSFSKYNLISCKVNEKDNKDYCPDCCSKYIEWCYNCGEPFVRDKNYHGNYCPSCKNNKGGIFYF